MENGAFERMDDGVSLAPPPPPSCEAAFGVRSGLRSNSYAWPTSALRDG